METQLAFLTQLRGVGRQKALMILAFDSNVENAASHYSYLKKGKIPGIGPERSREIWSQIRAHLSKKQNQLNNKNKI
jgi:hypothetical protein